MPLPDFGRRIPELDGIRGTAILIVIIFHWLIMEGTVILPSRFEQVGSFGWTGVDLFFVLSGFLIGGILMDMRCASNFFSVFYFRRCCRILPLYGAVCLLSLAVYYAHLSTHGWLFEGKIPWYAYLTFGQNFWMAKYNAVGSHQIDVTWSLAVEEQFYLTIPLVIWMVKPKYLLHVLISGIVLAPLLRMTLWFTLDLEHRVSATYLLAPCRMDVLLLGVLAAWAVRRESSWQWLLANKLVLNVSCFGLGLGFLVMIRMRWGLGSFALVSFGYTWIALFYLSLLLLAVTQKDSLASRIFKMRFLTELGSLAYGLFLFHQPVLGLAYALWVKASPKLEGAGEIGVTLLAAIPLALLARLSRDYFEKPLVNIGRRYQYAKEIPDRIHDSVSTYEAFEKSGFRRYPTKINLTEL
jgi:peptidoglycan/LPS O-acetylase OafA/YrhL